ncbi:MAG TPA: cytochrome c oxidase subunit 3 family protein [Oligoflexus sp.]|uniref:cytochrome c oxidase subunit 3 family protein n=1 Tax=Oligoflexus sp. TaxID=1971216 RepID=UPI002D7F4228|nr:cytochrome c oxidase subunit 3 family protein [Oligoflexus sp.]HET9240132.1 cytochrome c oxidase subunit 3 family protein [Oligoflexus sp.]
MPMINSLEKATNPTAPLHEHQFVALEQQKAAATAGMWVFLTSEIMFFGAIFSAFLIYGYLYPEVFAHFSQKLHLLLGSLNTGILLTSSWTMVMAVHGAQQQNRRLLLRSLVFTFLLGAVFLGIKGYEWSAEIRSGDFPGSGQVNPRQGEIFLRLYFIMTGFHGLHVLIGLLLITGLWIDTARKTNIPSSQLHFTENLGLYWHFVDIVWIFLFPMLYLMDKPRLPW